MSPAVRRQAPPPPTPAAAIAFTGCSVSSLSACPKFVADQLLSKLVTAKEEEGEEDNREQREAEVSLQPNVSHHVKL